MFERYAMASRKALYFGRLEADKRGAPEISGEHLLLGLIAAGESSLAGLLREHRYTTSGLRSEIEKLSAAVAAPSSDREELPLSELAYKSLLLAEDERVRTGLLEVLPEHIVAGLLRAGGASATVLAMSGLTVESVREAIKATLRS